MMVIHPKPGVAGKVILVTGASSGIGAAAARAWAAAGAAVVLAARRRERLIALAAEIEAAGGRDLVVPTDLLDQEQITRLVAASLEHFGRIDVLANIAGWGRYHWLEKLSAGEVRRQFDVNVLGAIELTRQVVPHLQGRRQGHVINMVSYASRIAVPPMTIYAATKYALEGFTDGLRRELAPWGIHVSRVHPAGVSGTEFNQQAAANGGIAYNAVPIGRLSQEQVARALVKLVAHPRRALFLGRSYDAAVLVNRRAPVLVDWLTGWWVRRHRAPELAAPACPPARRRRLAPVLALLSAAGLAAWYLGRWPPPQRD